MDFSEKMRLRGKAEEDMFFAELDKKLIDAMHEQQEIEQERLHQQQFEQDYYRTKRMFKGAESK
jgi:hypothetical protein